MNRKGTLIDFALRKLGFNLEPDQPENKGRPDGAAGGAPPPFMKPVQTDSNKPSNKGFLSFFKNFSPFETAQETEAVEFYKSHVKEWRGNLIEKNKSKSVSKSVTEETDGGLASGYDMNNQQVTAPANRAKPYNETSV